MGTPFPCVPAAFQQWERRSHAFPLEMTSEKNPKCGTCASLVEIEEKGFEVAPKRRKRKTIVSKEVSSSLKGRRMQMNVLRTKQVSHVESRDDHYQPIAGGDDQKCRRRVGSRSTDIQEPFCADISTPRRRL